MQLYLHAARIPEGYRKDTRRVADPLTDPLTDTLIDPLTDLLTDLSTDLSIHGRRAAFGGEAQFDRDRGRRAWDVAARPAPNRKTEAGPETRPAGRIPEGFQNHFGDLERWATLEPR